MAKTYYIETFGCQMNVHDSERLGGLLEQAGYEPIAAMDDADLVVVNTCSVRERAEEKLFARLDRFRHTDREARPVIAVTGCVAQQEGDKIRERAPMVDVVIGTQALAKLPEAVETARETWEPYVDVNPYDNVSFPLGIAARHDPVKAFVTIIEGCNDFCAFCVVPYTRGRERMRAAAEIVAEVEEVASQGHREVQLLGQIVNHYQAPDIPGCDFAGLLERVHDVPGIDRIRFASPHPRHVTRRMIEAMRDLPKVCKHLHLPVQSGSTRVLALMRRRHTRERYLALIDEVREAIPDITLSTDMIVGFPGESAEDFEETLTLTDCVQYHSMFSFKYSERPNTLARQRMPDSVTESEKARRLERLQALQRRTQLRLHERLVGEQVQVLAEAKSRGEPPNTADVRAVTRSSTFPPTPTASVQWSTCGSNAPAPTASGNARHGMTDDVPTGRSRGKTMQIEMTIKGLMVDPVTNMPIVILRDEASERVLPIWVGIFEANAIALQIENIETPRPMTHDLLRNVIANLNGAVEKIVVSDLKENTFYALIYVRIAEELVAVDARPSDAIALALRVSAPIYVEDDVIQNAKSIDFTPDKSDSERLAKWLESLDTEDLGKYKM